MIDLDDESKKWLSSQFTVESESRPSSMRSVAAPALPVLKEDGEDGKGSEAGSDDGGEGASWGLDDSGAATTFEEPEVFYLDTQGDTQGPFTLQQIRSWEQDG